MNVKEIKQDTETKMKKTLEDVQRKFMEVRTGRAHPGLIEGLHIDYYGTPTLLKQVAAISLSDARTLVIQAWDAAAIPEIEKAILNSKLGVKPAIDGKLVRINFPQLSQERREELKKVVKDLAEHDKVSLRTIRRDANEKIKKVQKDNLISEDDSFRAQEEIQKLTDRYIAEIDRILEEKSRELVETH